MLARRSLGKGGSIAREPFLGRHGRPAGARSPALSVSSPNRNPNLSCLYTLPLSPIHPVAVPGGTLKRFALFPFHP